MIQTPDIRAGRVDNVVEEGLDLRYYWRVLLRFKKGIIGLGLLFAIVAGLVSMSIANIYESSATLLVESNQLNITSIEQIYGLENAGREYFNTQFELLKSRPLAERVVRGLNLLEHPEFAPEPEQGGGWRDYLSSFFTDLFGGVLNRLPGAGDDTGSQIAAEQILMTRVLSAFNTRLTITPVRNTDLVDVRFESTDPQLAADVVNMLTYSYIENQLEQRLDSTRQANAWMTERLEGLKDTLEESERELQDFLEKENLVNVEGIEGITALNNQELDQLTSQVVEARRVRQEAGTLYRQAEALRGQPAEQLMNVPEILNHPALQRVIESVEGIEQEIAELSQRYGSNHPRMIALNSELQEAQGSFERQVQQILAGIETAYHNAMDNERAAQTRLNVAKGDYQNVNRKNFELRELQRTVETNRELYDMFFTRIRETSESSSFEDANAMVVDPGVPAVRPVKPRRKLIVAVALMAGLMLGTVLAFLRDMLDSTIHSPDDIEERLHASTLGLVPLAEENKNLKKDKEQHGKTSYLGFIDDSKSSFAESFRTLRTGIMLSSLDRPFKVIGVTSSVPNEGKSTLAVNLAAAIGQMHNTLLIDADMRRPSLARSIGLPLNSPGLSNYVAGTSELKDCLYEYKQGGFTVMPGGQLAPNPLELIASPRFRQMLEELGRQFDQIILDTPPTQAVSDALVIGSYSDATVYVVKSDATSIKAIRNGLTRLEYANANVLGVVLNQVDTRKDNGYYYGGYYDSYGYSGGDAT